MQKPPKPGKSGLGTRLAKVSDFSSDFQTKFPKFSSYFLYELFMSLRSQSQTEINSCRRGTIKVASKLIIVIRYVISNVSFTGLVLVDLFSSMTDIKCSFLQLLLFFLFSRNTLVQCPRLTFYTEVLNF